MNSLNTHGVLTEPPALSSRLPQWGKGREGNKEGKWKGGRVETPIHSSGSVTRGSRVGWMAATRFVGGVR